MKFFKKLGKAFQNVFYYLIEQLKDLETLIIFIIIVLIMSSPIIVGLTLYFLTGHQHLYIEIVTGYFAFWNLVPATPFTGIAILLTLAIKRSIDHFDAIRFKKIRNKLWFDDYNKLIDWYLKKEPYINDKSDFQIYVISLMLNSNELSDVLPVYNKFIEEFDDFKKLSTSNDRYIRHMWQSLNASYKAKSMVDFSIKMIKKNKALNDYSKKELKKMPGINKDVASVMLILFNKSNEVYLDKKIIKVLTRINGDISIMKMHATKKVYDNFITSLNVKDVRLFLKAFIKFSSDICNDNPKCENCPFKDYCICNKYKAFKALPRYRHRYKYRFITLFYAKFNGKIIIKKDRIKNFKSKYNLKHLKNMPDIDKINKKFNNIVGMSKNEVSVFIFKHKEYHVLTYNIDLSDYNLEKKEILVDESQLKDYLKDDLLYLFK